MIFSDLKCESRFRNWVICWIPIYLRLRIPIYLLLGPVNSYLNFCYYTILRKFLYYFYKKKILKIGYFFIFS